MERKVEKTERKETTTPQELARKLEQFPPNSFKELARLGQYVLEVGKAEKNDRISMQVRLKLGVNTILKVRSSEEFKIIKQAISLLESKKVLLEALDLLNTPRIKEVREIELDL